MDLMFYVLRDCFTDLIYIGLGHLHFLFICENGLVTYLVQMVQMVVQKIY